MSQVHGSEPPQLVGRALLLDAIYAVLTDLDDGKVPDDWENESVESFLKAFAALLRSIENTYSNRDEPLPEDPWVLVARAVRGARYYE